MSAPVKRNSGCRSFFIFVLGMITGVIVFLGAIAGTVYVIVSSYTLKDVESTLNVDIPLDNEEIMNKTLLELGKDLYTTLSNITTITVQQLMDKYGLPIPADLYGIDISPLFGYSITEMPNHMNEVLDSVTLAKVGSIAGIDFGSYNLPILTKSIDLPVMQAFDGLMRSFGGDMTMRSLNTNFGINLAGENELLSLFMDTSLDSIGAAIDYLELGELIDIDADLFLQLGATSRFVKTMRYEEVTDVNVSAADSQRYISGTDEIGLVYKEMRYVTEDEGLTYIVNNEEPQEGTTYYRLFEYEVYDPLVHTTATEFYVSAHLNNFEFEDPNYVPIVQGYFKLNDLFADESGTPIADYSNLTSGASYYIFDSATSTYILLDEFGVDGVATENSRLDTDFTGWLCVHTGTSDQAMQVLSSSNISELGNATDEIMTLPLGQLIDIDTSPTSTDPRIMQQLADTAICDLSSTVGTLTLSDAVAIDETSPKILQSLSDAQITDLSNSINALTLGQAIDIEASSHVVLRRLENSLITNISTEMTTVMNNLKLKELVEIQQYAVYSETLSSADYLLVQNDPLGTNYLYVVDNLNGNYYFDTVFKPIDLSYTVGTKYAKQYFSPLFINDTPEDLGEYVLIDGYGALYDAENPTHAELPRFNLVNAYIGNATDNLDANVMSATLNNVVETSQCVAIDTNYSQSSRMLISLGDVSVSNMGTSFSGLTMEQIIDIEADSFFDDNSIRTSTPSTLSTALGTRLSSATIGQLNYWGELGLNPIVLSVLRNYTVADFFAGLSWNGSQVVFTPAP